MAYHNDSESSTFHNQRFQGDMKSSSGSNNWKTYKKSLDSKTVCLKAIMLVNEAHPNKSCLCDELSTVPEAFVCLADNVRFVHRVVPVWLGLEEEG